MTPSRTNSVGHLLDLADTAYRLAFHILGPHGAAEDIVQQSYLKALSRGNARWSRAQERTWFLRTVANRARDHLRSETSRKRREAVKSAQRKPETSPPPMRPDLTAALRTALAGLEEKYRLPLVLCYQEEMKHGEAAAVLEMPRRTLTKYVNVGLERLRKTLARAGYAALPAMVLGGLKQTAPAVPASLAAGVEKFVAGAAMKTGGVSVTAGASASAAAKGGIAMKLVAGVVLAGAVAGGVAVSMKGGGAPLPAEKPRKFATPATDPGAEWENKGIWAGVGVSGYLDGPRREAMSYACPRPGIFTEDGSESIFRTYDPKTERFMTIGGCGSAGELDGPLSRARFGGWGYAVFGTMAGNSKYFFMITRSKNKSSLRRFDFRKRIVEPFAKDVTVGNVTKICGFEGGIFLQSRDNLKKVSDDGKLLAEYKLSFVPGGYGESLGPYDPKNDRLYGSSREGGGSDKNGWVVWRWDLKAGGKFEGLIGGGGNPANQPLRKQMATGPFKGSFFWCPGGLGFGPGDPDGRYPYMGGGDESNMYRLDLEKQAWIKLVPTADKKRWRFGEAPGKVQAWDAGGGIPWANDGTDNMYPGYRGWCKIYERVK